MATEAEAEISGGGEGRGGSEAVLRHRGGAGSGLVRQAYADRLTGQLHALRHARASSARGVPSGSAAADGGRREGVAPQGQSPARKVAAAAAAAAGATLRTAALHLEHAKRRPPPRDGGASKQILGMISSLQADLYQTP